MGYHSRVLKLALCHDPVAATKLLQSYATLPIPDSLACARRIFDDVPLAARDPPLCSALLSALARSSRPSDALRFFASLPPDITADNPFSFASAARAAAYAAVGPAIARALHGKALVHGLHDDVVVATSFLDMYSKCGDLVSARKLFYRMPRRNAVSWNAMIAAHVNAGMSECALDLFYRLRVMHPDMVDEFAVASILTACGGLSDLRSGAQIHALTLVLGMEMDNAIGSALSNMYFRCGDVECAERTMEGKEENIFSNLMMIKGYVFNERFDDAIAFMRSQGGVFARLALTDCSVVTSILTACAHSGLLRLGRQVHGFIFTLGLNELTIVTNEENAVIWSALIDMYSKCFNVKEAQAVFNRLSDKHIVNWNSMIAGCIYEGLIQEARRYFDLMPHRNVVSWTAMISGHVQHAAPEEGLRLLAKMYKERKLIRANGFTFATTLNACSSLAALDAGKQIHAQSLRTTVDNGLGSLALKTALVDMYSKSGNLSYSQRVFDRMNHKNVVSWTSLIAAYAAHGLGLQAIQVLERMISMGFKPNHVTFIVILSACSHSGLVAQGMHYFKLMREKYDISPTIDHYTCIVDMLGRAGRVEEALALVDEVEGDMTGLEGEIDLVNDKTSSIWGALLGGCIWHGNTRLKTKVAELIVARKQQPGDSYAAICNVYAASEMWNEVYKVTDEWKKHGVVKEPGQSQIHVRGSF